MSAKRAAARDGAETAGSKALPAGVEGFVPQDDAQVAALIAAPGPLVLLYSASWCAPCGQLLLDLQAVVDRLRGPDGGGKMTVLRLGVVDLEMCPEAGTRALMAAGQRGVPLLGVYRNGAPHGWHLGAMTRPALETWLRAQLG